MGDVSSHFSHAGSMSQLCPCPCWASKQSEVKQRGTVGGGGTQAGKMSGLGCLVLHAFSVWLQKGPPVPTIFGRAPLPRKATLSVSATPPSRPYPPRSRSEPLVRNRRLAFTNVPEMVVEIYAPSMWHRESDSANGSTNAKVRNLKLVTQVKSGL